MFRRDRVDRVIMNLKSYFELIINAENKQQYTSKLTLTKLSECIKQIYELLEGKIDVKPDSQNICRLIPKLIDPNDDLFYKLAKYRSRFSYETQTNISKILCFIVENSGKYGIQKYIKNKSNSLNGHNKIVDVLLNEFEQHPGGIFSVFQQMTKRSDLTSMFLKLKVTTPIHKKQQMNALTKSHNNNKSRHQKSGHHKSHTFNGNNMHSILPIKQNKNNLKKKRKHLLQSKSDNINPNKQLKHCKNKTTPILEAKSVNSILIEKKKDDLQETTTKDISFVEGLFVLIKWPSLHISLDAFKTLKYLFSTTNSKGNQNDKLTIYFYDHFDTLFNCQLNELITSQNTVHKRQSFLLLNEILTNANNFEILLKYITNKRNLWVSCRILTDEFISKHTDETNHNAIIDPLLEDYFMDAGDILIEIAKRKCLADLLLNRTFITRLKENENVIIDMDDIKCCDDTSCSIKAYAKASHKNLSYYLGMTNSQSELPYLNNMDSVASYSSDIAQIISPGGTITTRNRYSGDDVPCFKRSPLQFNHLSNNSLHECITERLFVMELISLINRSCSDLVAQYSFDVLRFLLTVNKKKASIFLEKYSDELIIKFNELIRLENQNTVRQKQFLGLLCDLLLEKKNSKFRKIFVSQVKNLKIIMNLLKCKSDAIKYDSFQIFAIFVLSKQKTRDIHIVLWKNAKYNNLIQFITSLLANKSLKYDGLDKGKKTVIQHLKQLPTPKSDESFVRLRV